MSQYVFNLEGQPRGYIIDPTNLPAGSRVIPLNPLNALWLTEDYPKREFGLSYMVVRNGDMRCTQPTSGRWRVHWIEENAEYHTLIDPLRLPPGSAVSPIRPLAPYWITDSAPFRQEGTDLWYLVAANEFIRVRLPLRLWLLPLEEDAKGQVGD